MLREGDNVVLTKDHMFAGYNLPAGTSGVVYHVREADGLIVVDVGDLHYQYGTNKKDLWKRDGSKDVKIAAIRSTLSDLIRRVEKLEETP